MNTNLDFCLALHRAHASLQLKLDDELGIHHGVSFNDFALLNLLAEADCSEAGQTKYRSAPKRRATQEHLRTTCHAQG